MNLADIRQEARKAASDIEIQWDRIDSDPFYKADFEGTIRMAIEAIPQIEHAWTLLQDTPEDWDKRELMLGLVEEELFASYQIQDLWDRYQQVNAIMALDISEPQ